MIETRTQGTDTSPQQLQRFVYSNHLGSVALELDETAQIISYEEYHPYGTTAYQANNADINAVAKRYRYTGKERDEESGLYYHGARYYIPWLVRWTAVDPLEAKYAPQSSYVYCSNNPINRVDPDGKGDHDKDLIKPYSSPVPLNSSTARAPINHTAVTVPIPDAEQLATLINSANAGNTNVSSTRVDRAHVHHQALAKKIEAIEMLRPKAYIGQKKEEHLTPEQLADLKAITTQMLEAEGYNVNGEKGFLRRLSENKHWQGFTENIVLPTAELAIVTTATASLVASETELAVAGAKTTFKQYAETAAYKTLTQLYLNNGDWSKVDKFDLTVSILNPLKDYGLAGKVVTDLGTAAIDIKNGELRTIFGSTASTRKELGNFTLDLVYGLSKTATKESFTLLGGKSPARDFFIDNVAGQHKNMVKDALNGH